MKTHKYTEPAFRWLEIIVGERFGHEWEIRPADQGLELRLKNSEGAIKFDRLQDCFLESRSDLPFTRWEANSEGWQSVLRDPIPAPGVASLPNPLIEKRATAHVIHYDVLGLCYWMLARVEEIGRTDLDAHGRFPATSSHSYRNDYTDRPIVDEWMHILAQVIQSQWPGIVLKSHEYSVQLSHDVDRPFLYANMRWSTLIKIALGDIFKRRDTTLAFRRLLAWSRVRGGNLSADPYNKFDWLMSISEANGVKSCFYFICGQSDERFDSDYDIASPLLLKLIGDIKSKGHKIGLHPSYNCINQNAQIAVELGRLRQACRRVGAGDEQFGARMHYLRWRQPDTMLALSEAGLTYDSTLIYPDRIGFRCGTCHAFPAFDALNGRQIPLRIIPLLVMDQLLINEEPGGSVEFLLERVSEMSRRVKMMGGVFTLLWHNSSLEMHDALYAQIVETVSHRPDYAVSS